MLQLPFYYILFEQKISTVMRAMRKKLNILMLHLPVYYILEQEISTRLVQMRTLQKRSERNRLSFFFYLEQIVVVVESSMQCLLLRLKSRSAREASPHADFMGNYPTGSHTCQLYLPRRFAFLFVPGVALNGMSTLGESKVFSFSFWF